MVNSTHMVDPMPMEDQIHKMEPIPIMEHMSLHTNSIMHRNIAFDTGQ